MKTFAQTRKENKGLKRLLNGVVSVSNSASLKIKFT